MATISCLTWVKRGVAKQNPDKITLSEDELKKLILSQESRLNSLDLDEDDEEESETVQTEAESGAVKRKRVRKESNSDSDNDENEKSVDAIAKKYGLDDYDDDNEDFNYKEEEEGGGALGMSGVAYYATQKEDPYVTKDSDDEDEDDKVLPDDNMLAMGKMSGDFCSLEVYVYNEAEDNMFCHHDILLPTFPLALEWLSFDPSEDKPGNYIAMGTMEPDIEIWDMDVMDTMEPAFILAGQKKKKKKKKKTGSVDGGGHSDAVLDLSWNSMQPKVLASASADFTVGIWDLSQGVMVSSIKHHTEKVQCVEWHPYEAQSLLSGSYDNTVKVYDCRSPDDAHKSWKLPGEVERVAWNLHDPYYFLASTDTGHVAYVDIRAGEKPVWTLQAHKEAVTGLALSNTIPGCLMTASLDKSAKVWDIRDNKPFSVLERHPKLGALSCLFASPDSGLIFAIAGESDMRVINMQKNETVAKHFGKTVIGGESTSDMYVAAAGMEDDGEEAEALGLSATAEAPSEESQSKPEKKKKKKKKKSKPEGD